MAAVVAVGLAGCFPAPSTSAAKKAADASPCVTWTDITSYKGGPDVAAGSNAAIGITPGCSLSQVRKLASAVWSGLRDQHGLALYVLAKKPVGLYAGEGGVSATYDQTTSAAFSVDADGGSEAVTAADVAQGVTDWFDIREHVDPRAQLSVEVPDFSEQGSYYPPWTSADEQIWVHVGGAAEALALSAKVPTRLQQAYWDVNLPGPIFVAGAGLPWSQSVKLAQALSDTGLYAAVSVDSPSADSDAPVTNPSMFADALMKKGPKTPEFSASSPAWPQVEAMVDALDATGTSFTFEIGMDRSDEPFDPLGDSLDAPYPDLDTKRCVPYPTDHETSTPAIDQALYDYWLNPQRPRTAASSATKSCAHGERTLLKSATTDPGAASGS